MIGARIKALFARLRPAKPARPVRRGGVPKATDREGLLLRICERIEVDSVSQCWNWTGATDREGRAMVRVAERVLYVSRVVLMLAGVAFKRGEGALHTCDNPRCVRPDHLFVGTDADNSADKVRKGRQARGRGARRGGAVLGESDARAIYAAAGRHAEIARRFGVSPDAVGKIKRRRTWRHLHADPAEGPENPASGRG